MKEKILLIGGGGHCKSVVDVIESTNKYEIYGIIDKENNLGKEVLGYKIIGCDDDLCKLVQSVKNVVVTVGHMYDNNVRKHLYNLAKSLGFNLPTIVSPYAYVSKHAILGEGNVIMHFAFINAGVKIGNGCIINTKAIIEHDAIIEDHCHISTGAIINGGVIVKENTFVGSNATTKQYISISGFIKAGSLVKTNI